MSSFRVAVRSQSSFAGETGDTSNWKVGGSRVCVPRPFITERQISSCQRAGSFWKASIVSGRGDGKKLKKKKRKIPHPPLSNKLIKSYTNHHAKKLDTLVWLMGENFVRMLWATIPSTDVVVAKKVGTERLRQRWF